MPYLSHVGIIEALLPGLIALTSILVVVIAFLLERYISASELSVRKKKIEREKYRNLTLHMTVAFTTSGIGSILSLLFLLGIGSESVSLAFYITILISFTLSILLVMIGMWITVKKILWGGNGSF
jgi:predicted lysophospholipase L1 biosynthesis ABC-type transport system permease subunit